MDTPNGKNQNHGTNPDDRSGERDAQRHQSSADLDKDGAKKRSTTRVVSSRADRLDRIRRFTVVLIAVFLIYGLFSINYSWMFRPLNERVVILSGIFSLIVGLSLTAMMYLQNGFRTKIYSPSDFQISQVTYPLFSNEINVQPTAKEGISSEKPMAESSPEFDTLLNAFLEQAKKQPKEVIWADLLALARRASKTTEADASVTQGFDSARSRLMSEIASLGRRGSFNLTLGMAISAIGLLVLGFFFYSTTDITRIMAEKLTSGEGNVEVREALSFSILFIPRLSFVLLIELFAYFFLKQYKSTLDEIKYFQNEITNIESKAIALRVSLIADTPANLSKSIGALVETERNHILEKGQTTVELERARLERLDLAEIVKQSGGLLDKLKLRK